MSTNFQIDTRNKSKYIAAKQAICNIMQNKAAIIKGIPLSYLIYSTTTGREPNDIDILLHRDDLKSAQNILNLYGFFQRDDSVKKARENRVMCMSSSHQVVPFTKVIGSSSISVDLNFDIFWGEYTGKRIDISEFLHDTMDMNIYGIKIKTLPPVKALIQLILHHYKDMNSIFLLSTRKSIKCDMFKDIYFLLKNNIESIPISKLYAIGEEYEIIPYVYYIFYHTGLLFEDETLKKYIAAFETPYGKTLLNYYGLNDSERHEWKFDFKKRLECENLYDIIKDDLTVKDIDKININKEIFLNA